MKKNYIILQGFKELIILFFLSLLSFSFKLNAQTKPVITNITTDSGTSSTDYITNDSSLILSGTSDPGSIITLKLNGLSTSLFGKSTITDINGNFSFDFIEQTVEIGDGSFTIIAESTLGATEQESDPITLVLDTTTPSVKSIDLIGTPDKHSTSISFIVKFSEVVSSFSEDDFELVITNGSVRASISSISPASGTDSSLIVNISISHPEEDMGDLSLQLKNNTNIIDIAGNGNGSNGYIASHTSSDIHKVNQGTLSNNLPNLKEYIQIAYTNNTKTLSIESKQQIDEIKLYDVFGKQVLSSKELNINLAFLTKGIYIVQVISKGQALNKKIIK